MMVHMHAEFVGFGEGKHKHLCIILCIYNDEENREARCM
jgi:hypothetical protein